jgi:F-type H+-transporting ATPase subunit a
MTFLAPLFAETDRGLTQYPVPLFRILGVDFNNSMTSALVVTIIIIAFVQVAMRHPKLVPTGLQNFVEWIVEILVNQLDNLLGHETTIRGFWYFGGLFTFIFLSNLFGLIPGVGTFGWGHEMNGHFQVTQPFLRGVNANDNTTAAYTAVFFFMFFYWCFRRLGFWGFLVHTFGSKVKFQNPVANWLFIFIFFMVGWVEIFSIFIVRPIAFTFRLYGNIFGGEFLLDSMYKMMPNFAFIVLVPFYFYELLVAFVQALVFLLLTAAFTGMFTNSPDHADEHGKEEKAHH